MAALDNLHPPRRATRPGRILVTVLVAVALMAAACGDDEDDATVGPSSTGAPAAQGSTQGVTESSVKIGVAIPDVSVFEQINPAYAAGPQEKYYEALLEHWADEGKATIAGRRVELVTRTYPSTDENAKRAACVGLVEEEKVMAVLAPGNFATALDCVAKEHRVPVITTDFVDDDTLAANAPYLFSLHLTGDNLMRNFARWAVEEGLLDGKRIGVYYSKQGAKPDQYFNVLKAELEEAGHELAEVVTTTNPLGGPDDNLAVQRLKAAGADVVILNVSIASRLGFWNFADSQGYKPTYIDSDYIWNTDDSVSVPALASQFDGTLGFTAYTNGASGAKEYPEPLRTCLDVGARAAGRPINENYNEWRYLTSACDLVHTLMLALEHAGEGLDASSFIEGVEAIHEVPMARHELVDFSSDRHEGSATYRTVQWTASCTCWMPAGDGEYSPLLVK